MKRIFSIFFLSAVAVAAAAPSLITIAGKPVLCLQLPAQAEVKTEGARTNIRATEAQLYLQLWPLENAQTVEQGAGLISGFLAAKDVTRFQASVTNHITVAGQPALHLVGDGKEQDDGDPSQADVVVFSVGNKIFAACDHGEDRVPAEVAAMLKVLDSARLPGPDKRMNILVLLEDDLRYDSLSCAGDPVVKTPNIDRLATEGVRFTHACVTTPICGVSRASIFTGQWMSRHGDHRMKMFKTPWAETYPGLLRTNGYYVGHVGKWHNGRFPAENFDFGRAYSGQHWIQQADGTKIHVTQKNENDALEFLRTRPKDKPFCLTLAFFAPHAVDGNPLQYMPQPQSMKLYQDVTVPVPFNATEESWHRLPAFVANETNESRVRWHWRFDTPEKFQTMMKNYYRLITEVDATCGRVLAELKAQGLLDNTLVIFTGDNGYFHSEHELAEKWYPYQESIRVPMIVRDPRMSRAKISATNDEFVLNVDIAPTILAAAGIPEPPMMQGRDFAPLYLAKKSPDWRTEFFEEHVSSTNGVFIPASQGLVRKDWKYILWPDYQREQLFNLNADPHEEHDLAQDPDQKGRLAELRQRFNELKAAAGAPEAKK